MCFIYRWVAMCLVVCASLLGQMPEQSVDVVVLGGGVGGLTSAIYLARGGATPLVLQGKNPGGAIVKSKSVQNWPGDLEISGSDLMEKMTEQARKNGVILSAEEMISIDLSSRPFTLIVQDVYDSSKQRKILAEACIIAMGSKNRPLGVVGEEEFAYRGVCSCAFCDGPLYKERDVAVVGGGDSAVWDAEYLSGIAKKVYVLVRGEELKGIEVARKEKMLSRENVVVFYNTQVEEIKGNEEGVTSIVIREHGKEKQEIPVEAVFLAIGSIPNTGPFAGQLELDKEGYVVVKNYTETSVPGVFAVGDIADPKFKQAVSAGGEGAKAAIQAQLYLAKKSIRSNLSEVNTSSAVSDKPVEIRDMKQLQQVLKESRIPVVVDFYATWCSPCRQLSPHLDQWAAELKGKVLICKVNVDVGRDLVSHYNIRSMPTMLQLDPQGREMVRKVGVPEITQYINSLKAV